MLQSIVRFALGVLFTWLVAKGAVTQDQVNSDLPTIVEAVCMVLLTVGSLAWTYFEKLAKGHITATGQTVSLAPPAPVKMVDASNLPKQPESKP